MGIKHKAVQGLSKDVKNSLTAAMRILEESTLLCLDTTAVKDIVMEAYTTLLTMDSMPATPLRDGVYSLLRKMKAGFSAETEQLVHSRPDFIRALVNTTMFEHILPSSIFFTNRFKKEQQHAALSYNPVFYAGASSLFDETFTQEELDAIFLGLKNATDHIRSMTENEAEVLDLLDNLVKQQSRTASPFGMAESLPDILA